MLNHRQKMRKALPPWCLYLPIRWRCLIDAPNFHRAWLIDSSCFMQVARYHRERAVLVKLAQHLLIFLYLIRFVISYGSSSCIGAA